MFEYALRICGFNVSSAGDGLSALHALDQDFIPAAIVLDLDLPQVSGVDVQQEMAAHAETRAIPVIVVTGTSWRAPAGVFRTLRKPINLDILVSVVQRALEQQAEQARQPRSSQHQLSADSF